MNCRYQCMKCKTLFEATITGAVRCPRCEHIYVEWLNYKAVINHLMKTDKEYRESYSN